MNKKISVGTVFSGIGAPEFALKRLGIPYSVAFACDNGELPLTKSDDEINATINGLVSIQEKKKYIESIVPHKTNFVKTSYCANYDCDALDYYHDVRYLDGTQYKGKIDLFVGGSPCQSFTLLGYQKGLEEARGTLFYEFARLVKEIEPKVFVYENVQGLVKHDGGKTWAVVKRVFHSLGYKIYHKVLDASDYGIPQKRRRVFVVGFHDPNAIFAFPETQQLKYTMQDFLQDNVAFGDFTSNNGKIEIKRNGEIVEEKYFLSDKILPGIMCSGTGGFNMKPEIDLSIARPLMSSMHKMHRAGEDNYVTTNGRIRRLTPRECLRLMGFTDDFKQVVSDTQLYRQAGNSVVVDVLMGIFKEIEKTMGGINQ